MKLRIRLRHLRLGKSQITAKCATGNAIAKTEIFFGNESVVCLHRQFVFFYCVVLSTIVFSTMLFCPLRLNTIRAGPASPSLPPITVLFPSRLRAVSKSFPSRLRAVSESFPSRFRANYDPSPYDIHIISV